jgi:hypothetical protein
MWKTPILLIMYFNNEPKFNASKEAKDLSNKYFVKLLKMIHVNECGIAWKVAKFCALEEIESLIPVLEKFNSPDIENHKLILNELKILNNESAKVSVGS